jgi:hypothetical protein
MIPAFFQKYYETYPLRTILFVASFFRVIAAIFSRGFGFSDDHFMVIEVAQQWIEGQDHNRWLPWDGNTDTNGPSLLYPGLHYFLFLFFKQIGIIDPEIKMLLVRLIHAFYSLLIVSYSYKITEKLSGIVIAKQVGWMLALFWLLPMMSVRNAVEIVCIPPLLIATWQLLNAEDKKHKTLTYLVAGIIAGLAFSIRFQTLLFIGGMGLALWWQRKWLQGIWFGVGACLSIFIVQNAIDYSLWGRLFVALNYYVSYNMANAYNYIVGPWYNYILLFAGLLIPPISLMLFYGMAKSFKKYLIVLLPALCFFIFHSYFPNKQERFVLPCLPFFIMAGIAGWEQISQQASYWINRKKLIKGSWIFFGIINSTLLVLLTPSSSKIARVDAMTYLYQNRQNWNTFMIEQSTAWNIVIPPMYYLNEFNNHYSVCGETNAEKVFGDIQKNNQPLPDYILFAETKDLEKRVENIKQYMPNIELEAVVESSYLDKIMYKLNPINAELKFYIYRNKN